MENTNILQLRRRFEQNYSDYRRQMLEMCGECVFEFAGEIAAFRHVYSYVMAHDWTSEDVAVLLLKFDNPLRIIVDEWRGYAEDNSASFESFAFEFNMDFLMDDGYIPGSVAAVTAIEIQDDLLGVMDELLNLAETVAQCLTVLNPTNSEFSKLFDFDEDGFFVYPRGSDSE